MSQGTWFGPGGFLDRSRSVAPPGYNRWFVPPAALAIHLSIGEAYAFSVFNLPLAASGGWSLEDVGWVFSIAIVFLGLSAAVFGPWLERVGPRKAMFASAACFGGGFLVSALGVHWQQLWLVFLGYGVLGGVGLGLGYISPVSTLIKWFPDRPGMATGFAIMGFGGGALIGSPLSHLLMEQFRSDTSTGVAGAFAALGVIYFAFMMFGVITVRLPAPGWRPAGYVPGLARAPAPGDVTADRAIRTPQFWLLWAVLCLNVTAGIGVLGQASPMIQEMFPGLVTAAAAAGFVGLLSLFNMAGRIAWSSLSDVIGRKPTYAIFFALGALLYALTPQTGRLGSVVLFVLLYAVIMSMYGGGFATIPAYLRDQFGTAQVGAIHGRLLTAWSLAGVAGPVLVNYIRKYQIDHGTPKAEAYTVTMYLMAGLLVTGFVCNLLVRPVGRPQQADPDTDTTPRGGRAGTRTRRARPAVAGVPVAVGRGAARLGSVEHGREVPGPVPVNSPRGRSASPTVSSAAVGEALLPRAQRRGFPVAAGKSRYHNTHRNRRHPMKGQQDIIDGLNRALTIELTAINQYFVQAKMCKNWGFMKLAHKHYEESIGEMKHADKLIERILFLEGVPEIARYDVIRVGENVREQFENDLKLELGGVAAYNELVDLCIKRKDNGTHALALEILKESEEHVDWLETQIGLLDAVGTERYLAEQMAGDEDEA